jgi:hypothetical protein
MIEAQTLRDQVRQARIEGARISDLKKRFNLGVNRVMEFVADIPSTREAMLRKIGSMMSFQPDWNDEQIATKLGCPVQIVSDRRAVLTSGKVKYVTTHTGGTIADTLDHGRRISKTWMRQHCSRGQRDLRQIQAIAGSDNYTLAEIKRSAVEAGLPVHASSGLVGTPRKEPESDTVIRERRYKIGSLGTRRRTY